MKPLVISAPFGNWITSEHATSTLGTYTVQNRSGVFPFPRWYMLWRILYTLRYRPAVGGWTNRLGLPSPGIRHLEKIGRTVGSSPSASGAAANLALHGKIVSLNGFNREEWIELISRTYALGAMPSGGMCFDMELNVSCVSGDTRVMTRDGYVQIGSMVRRQTPVLTEWGEKVSDGASSRGSKRALRIRTRTNDTLVATGDHRVKILRDDGSIHWERVDALQVGDLLLRRRGSGKMLPKSRGESHDFWYLIGFLYGDGHRYQHGPLSWSVAENKLALLPRLESALKELGADFSIRTRGASKRGGVSRHESETTILCSCKAVHDVLPAWAPKGRWRNSVPDILWTRGEAQISAFLSGLFDTDGGMSSEGAPVILTTSRPKLAKDVQSLLLLLGIVSTILVRRHAPPPKESAFSGSSARSLSVHTIGWKSLRLFREVVDFNHPKKSAALDAAIERSETRLRDRVLGYHHASGVIRRAIPVGSGMGGTALADSVSATIRALRSGRTDFLSDAKMHDVVERIDELVEDGEALSDLRDYMANDWWFDRVASIREIQAPIKVFDVFGSESESYVASGFVSHNCPNVGHLSIPKDLFESAVQIAGADSLIAKLPPVSYLEAFGLAYAAGVRRFHATNTLPVPAGGLSGKALKRVSLDVVKRLKDLKPDITIIGGGGITTPDDVADFRRAGATHVAVASALLKPTRGWFKGPRERFLKEIAEAARSEMKTETKA